MSRRISLARELDVIRVSVGAVLVLVDDLRGVAAGPATAALATSMHGVLILLDVRLRDLDRLVGGELDPEAAWTTHTAAPTSDRTDGDIVLEWDDKQRIRHHKRELRRLELNRQYRKRRRGTR